MIHAGRMRMLVASAICLLLRLTQTSFGNAVLADAELILPESIRLLEISDLLKKHPTCAEFLLGGNRWRPNAAKLARVDQPDSPSL